MQVHYQNPIRCSKYDYAKVKLELMYSLDREITQIKFLDQRRKEICSIRSRLVDDEQIISADRVTQHVPEGHEIIGIKCNIAVNKPSNCIARSEGIQDVAFLLWSSKEEDSLANGDECL